MNQLARIAARGAERRREADSEDEYKPPVKVAKAKSKEVLPDPRLVKPNPTPVPMERLLMLVANILDIIIKRRGKLQTLTLP